MRLVESVDRKPTPWFWGINGAAGVLASVLAVTISMAFGINVTMSVAGFCYLGLIPVAMVLIRQGHRKATALGMAARQCCRSLIGGPERAAPRHMVEVRDLLF